MDKKQLQNLLDSWPDVEFFVLDGLDDAILGVASRKLMEQPVLLYSVAKIIDILEAKFLPNAGEDAREDAWEWFSYNIEDAWIGPGTPIFLYDEFIDLLDLPDQDFEAGGTD